MSTLSPLASATPLPAARLALPAPPALAGLVHYFHVERASGGAVLVPATRFPMLTFFLAGGSLAPGPNGHMRLFDAPMISGPLSAGMPAYWLPGTTFISAILDPPALGALLRLSPGELRNAPVPLAWALPALPVEQVQEQLLAAAGPAGWVQVLSAWLLALADRGEQRWRGSFRLPQQWLFQPAPEIARQCGVGVRQLERRFLAAYGQSLRDSRRMARYERALGLLIADPLRPRGALTRVAMDAGYHDQAHMVRDFVDYLGLPPGSLLAGPEHGELRLLRYDAASRAVLLAGR